MRAVCWLVLLGVLSGCEDDSTSADRRADARPGDAGAADAAPLVAVPGDLRPLVLGVWGAAADAVWFVGGQPGPYGRLVARFDGAAVARENAPPGPGLWWVFGLDAERVWACGQGGVILARRGDRWVEEPSGLPDTTVLWGLWASGSDDLWAVGGSTVPGGPKGVLLRSAGDGTWRPVEDPALPTDANLFKVWGSGPDDVHIVGDRGVALHWNGSAFRRVDTAEPELLFTVHGRVGGPVLTVGGTARGGVWRWAEGWQPEALPEGTPGLNGVFVRADGTAIATGAFGTVLLRDDGGAWRRIEEADFGRDTLHAVWAGADTWAVGGDLVRAAHGLIATTRRPLPALSIGPPPDAEVPDAEVPDARVEDATPPDRGLDAEPRDAEPDADPADADRDTAPRDALTDARPPPRDMAPPPPDVAPPPPDMAPPPPDAAPLPGPGEPCPGTECSGRLSCLFIFPAGVRPYCTRACAVAADCGREFGPNPCCLIPGPQEFQPYCVPGEVLQEPCPPE